MLDVKQCLADCEEKMEMSVMHLEDALSHIRAGKANVHILDEIRVNSYGSMVPLNNVSAITTPDARTIAIKPWDKQMFRVIEKAIIDSPKATAKSYVSPFRLSPKKDAATLPSSAAKKPRSARWPSATPVATVSTN